MLTGPRLLAAALAALYIAFLAWYGGFGAPMSVAERDGLLAEIKRNAAAMPEGDGHLFERLQELAAQDDGREFYMLNLIRFHEKAQYPPGAPYAGSGLDADARYNAAIIPALLKHGNIPVFLGAPQGRFLAETGDIEWQRVAIVRYESRRALLKMIREIAGKPVGIHKWAAIERTHVFPVRPVFTLIFVRGFVAALLLGLGLALHFGLKRWPRYAGAAR